MKFLKIGFAFMSISLFVNACNQNETAKTNAPANTEKTVNNNSTPQPVATADTFAETRKIYKEKCAQCHQDNGSGGKVVIEGTTINAKSLISDNAKKDPDSEFIEAVEKGFPEDGMPGFKGKLTDAQIKDIVKFIRTELQK